MNDTEVTSPHVPQPVVLRFKVEHQFAGLRLDSFIQSQIPRLSRSKAARIIRATARYEDGRTGKPSDITRVGQIVFLVRESFEEPEAPNTYEVLFEDDSLFVIDKPAGLPMHPTATYHRSTLTWLLRERYGHLAPRPAHRLDRETSGVLLCAKTLEVERKLKAAFEHRQTRKQYLAVVRGVVDTDHDWIRLPMGRAKEGLHLLMAVGEGSEAVTEFSVIARAPSHSLVLLKPHTGRQHQLRVHMAAMAHPIVGDKLYGPEGTVPFYEIIRTGLTEDLVMRLGHPRHALHAFRLEIPSLDGNHTMTFESPFPNDLQTLWLSLGGRPLPKT